MPVSSEHTRGSSCSTANKTMASKTNLSIFLRLALLRAMMPFLASTSSDMGSMPFWLMMTKFLGLPAAEELPEVLASRAWSQTWFLSSTIFLSLASMKRRSDSTSFSRCSAEE